MAKIDELKESLNTLRVFFSVIIALMVAIGSGIVNSYRDNILDIPFWVGFIIEAILLICIIIIIKKINLKTKEIGDI
jgi:hypothetical protein